MTEQTSQPLTEQQLDEYEALARNATLLGADIASPNILSVLVAEIRRLRAAPVEDTLPAWLYQRFNDDLDAPAWDLLTGADQTYWEHHAAAVRRAVARGGFKAADGAQR